MPPDPTLPSLLLPEAASVATSNAPTAAMAINSAQSGGAPNIANAAMARMAAVNHARTSSPMNVQNALLSQAHLNSPSARSQRETSADANKRRRLNSSISGTIPTTASLLRQSSLGPSTGTPKAATPIPSSSRQASLQPNRKAPHNKKVAPHQAAASSSNRKRIRSGNAALKKGDRKRHLTSPTPSSSHGSVSPTSSTLPIGTDGTVEHASRLRGIRAASAASDEEGEEAEPDAEGEEDDTQVYCVCQRVSFGDMVACDNDDCPHQWFHWGCVDLKAEPKGEWLCPHCRELPRNKIVKTLDK
jgi:inhibitor of growth protein 3